MTGSLAPAASSLPAGGRASVSSSAPAVVVERPPKGLGRGRFEGPFWLVALLGALALAVTVAFYVRRLRRRFRS
jgi:hypothetical protein